MVDTADTVDMGAKNLINRISTDWKRVILPVYERYKESIDAVLNQDGLVPPPDSIFYCFDHFDLKDLRVIIIGQDPYINEGEAMGLCFSVSNKKPPCPPSLKNIFKELESEYGVKRTSTDLTDWAKQGVLLLNTSLTTLLGKSGHHINIWKNFTKDLLISIVKEKQDIVFMLWGAFAQDIFNSVDKQNPGSKGLVLRHTHPSPLSRKPFVGCGHFKACNDWLKENGKEEIRWV